MRLALLGLANLLGALSSSFAVLFVCRILAGIGAGGLPSDWQLFNVDGMSGENRKMTREACEIILKLWTANEPFEFKGNYWTVNRIGPMFNGALSYYLKPFQNPHPPIGIAGLSPRMLRQQNTRLCKPFVPSEVSYCQPILMRGFWN